MKCEICKCDTYVIHINAKHQKVCTQCYHDGEKNGTGSQPANSGKKEVL
ncbi:MAG: hypothetical protein V3S16_02535 [Candidatus Desulfatibia sp.]